MQCLFHISVSFDRPHHPLCRHVPSTSSLTEANEIRRWLLDLDPFGEAEDGDEDESRVARGRASPGSVVNRGMVGLRCEGVEGVAEAMVTGWWPSIKGLRERASVEVVRTWGIPAPNY